MGPAEVIALLGAPLNLRRTPFEGVEAWHYSRATGSSYRQRIVIVNHGRVERLVHELWVD
jgi:hypothetical protein